MQKKKYLIISIVIMLLLISIYAINYNSINKKISRDLGTPIPSSLDIKYEDSHHWFLGDGITQAKATLNDEQIDKIVSNSDVQWSKTPIPTNIAGTIYNKVFVDDKSNNIEPEIGMSETEIENGYWIFKNRTSKDGSQSLTDTKLSNYSIGIIDTDNNVFYYIKFDS